MDLGLKGRTAIVTGGSKGIGKAIVKELASEGVKVAICARGREELLSAAKEIKEITGGEIFAEVADVTSREQTDVFANRVVKEFGRVDILVNNAGKAQPGTFQDLSDEDWVNDINVKLFSIIRFSRAAIPFMKANGWGRIVNVNSVIGRQSIPGFMATTTNRGSSIAFTKALADELAPYNILVNSVNIGLVLTPQWENIWKKRGSGMSFEDFQKKFTETYVPLKRFGRPEEVAGIVAFLVSERNTYITGASVDVAGGMGRYI